MGEEANREHYKAIRAEHRGALMKITKEIDDVMAVEALSDKHYHKLNVMYWQLESKAKVLADLDNEVMKCYELGDIKKEVQESDAITIKITKY